jgi:hypothetical protein
MPHILPDKRHTPIPSLIPFPTQPPQVRYDVDGEAMPPAPSEPKQGRRLMDRIFRAFILLVLMLLNTINFWHRNLLYNLAATDTPGCEQVGWTGGS